MPRLSQILPETSTTKVDAYDLTVTFRPGAATPEMQDQALALVEQQREGAAVAKALSLILVEWDLMDDAGNPYPTTEQSLRQLPGKFISDVFAWLLETQRPNAKKSEGSGGSF